MNNDNDRPALPAPGTPEMMDYALRSLRDFARRSARDMIRRQDEPRTVVVRHIDWP